MRGRADLTPLLRVCDDNRPSPPAQPQIFIPQLYRQSKLSGRRDSNSRPSAPKADALTSLRYTPKFQEGMLLKHDHGDSNSVPLTFGLAVLTSDNRAPPAHPKAKKKAGMLLSQGITSPMKITLRSPAQPEVRGRACCWRCVPFLGEHIASGPSQIGKIPKTRARGM